jgi:AcrR family transcriptional regulator
MIATPRKRSAKSVRAADGTVKTSNGTAKSAETVGAILLAAEEVLISVGHADFTARKVAEQAGIALGNLTYHFPTMKSLQTSLIDAILSRYLAKWEKFRHDIEVGKLAPSSLGETMGWLIADAVEHRTMRLFRELWAMASQSPAAAKAMDHFYRQVVDAAAKVARLQFPGLSEAQSKNLAYLMAVISEGCIVLFGTLPEASTRLPAFQQLALQALEGALGAYSSPRSHSKVAELPDRVRSRASRQ